MELCLFYRTLFLLTKIIFDIPIKNLIHFFSPVFRNK